MRRLSSCIVHSLHSPQRVPTHSHAEDDNENATVQSFQDWCRHSLSDHQHQQKACPGLLSRLQSPTALSRYPSIHLLAPLGHCNQTEIPHVNAECSTTRAHYAYSEGRRTIRSIPSMILYALIPPLWVGAVVRWDMEAANWRLAGG